MASPTMKARTSRPGPVALCGVSLLTAAGRALVNALAATCACRRHPAPTCEGFLPTTPGERQRYMRQKDSRAKGHSYPQVWHEDAIGGLPGELGSLDETVIAEVVKQYGAGLARPDEVTLSRIEREREGALQRLAKTRDVAAWPATMARLDAEQQVAEQPRQRRRLAPDEVVAYLRSLPSQTEPR